MMTRRIELSPRLRLAADLVPEGARLADVGTDHAYLPACLLMEGKIPSAIAADLREGPLSRARETAAEYGCGDRMAFRLCDGLSGIRPEETDAVVIAGMGGETIAQILEAAPWVRTRKIPLVLQPMSSIPELRQWLGEDAAIGIAHGKMVERELSSVMQQMADGEIQVLVCTTIIETGIDIPNVNTLIIEDADRLGLSQLHQIRGRIGRSARRAYAYLTYRPGKVLTEVAGKRLSAIREYVAFGSGFRIAMRDLEIRGAGNLLGPEQSGYLMSVGYDMYLRLLNDAVLEQQGRGKDIRPDCSADLATSAHIPERYVPSAHQRMDLYRRMAAIRTTEEASDLVDELTDRYGDPPKPVMALLDVALLRAAAADVFITDITQRAGVVAFTFDSRVDVPSLMAVCSMPGYRNRLRLSAGEPPRLRLHLAPGEDALSAAGKLTEELRLKKEELGKAAREGDNL